MQSRPGYKRGIEAKVVSDLKPHPNNARTHSKHQVRQIAESIKTFGFTNPILIDAQNRIIAGHGRVAAAKFLGVNEVPTLRLDHLSDDQIRAYVIADNKLAENAGWDTSILAIELDYLMKLECQDFDVTITGFEIPEIDLILLENQVSPDIEDNLLAISDNTAPVSRSGDLWHLGRHRVLCGNSLRDESLSSLMLNRRAAVVFCDPPYNVRIDGHATGNGATRHREFQMASGEMSEAEFINFLETGLRLLVNYTVSNSVHFICMDWRHVGELLTAGRQVYDELLNLCVWVKDRGGMGSFYRSQHEFVLVFRKGKRHRNNVQLGQFGRNRTNVWNYPAIQSLSKQNADSALLKLHPTVKPVAMVADAILDCSARNEIVLDTFLGSGTTLMAAERVGRICYAIELDPVYVDLAIRRWQRQTGDSAVHAESGQRFEEVERDRLEGPREANRR